MSSIWFVYVRHLDNRVRASLFGKFEGLFKCEWGP
jgi:hypothetical protein